MGWGRICGGGGGPQAEQFAIQLDESTDVSFKDQLLRVPEEVEKEHTLLSKGKCNWNSNI
jgi:hypothetical protein